MKVERSAGAIIFRKEKEKILYLLIKHDHKHGGHWDFAKGHIEKGEKTKEAARREVFEETGIKKIKLVPGFKKIIKFRFTWPPRVKKQEWRMKFVIFFVAETKMNKVKLSHEHVDYKWIEYKDALKQLTHKTAKDVLAKAHEFLS